MQKVIFVVDDVDSTRYPMERLLNAEGYATQGASNGEEALSALQSFTPDLILLDLAMPEMNGPELLSHLRDIPRLASLPVIVVTGESASRSETRARELGVRDVLMKAQYSVQQLLNSIGHELSEPPA